MDTVYSTLTNIWSAYTEASDIYSSYILYSSYVIVGAVFKDFVMLVYNDVMFFRDIINDDGMDKVIEAFKPNDF